MIDVSSSSCSCVLCDRGNEREVADEEVEMDDGGDGERDDTSCTCVVISISILFDVILINNCIKLNGTINWQSNQMCKDEGINKCT
jgi:hypothetical protein